MRPSAMGILCGTAVLSLVLVHAEAQNAPQASALQVGPATVAAHWSKYDYPRTIPEGASYYIIQKGDTLWDLARRFLGNPFLWPQIWDRNRYITDAHWIYPGDPLIIPQVGVVTERAGEPEAAAPGAEPAPAVTPAPAVGEVLFPVIEEVALQCAPYVVDEPEDQSLHLIGSEQGATKTMFGDRDVMYLSKGSNGGVKPGDVYTLQHPTYDVKHPDTRRTIGHKVETTGWLRVVLVQENSATGIVEQACSDIHLGDYLKPFARVTVPMLPRRPPPTRLTLPTGKQEGAVVDIEADSAIAAAGQLVILNLGSRNGIAPGNSLVVYRMMYPSVPTPRVVLGEIVVVAVREKTSVAKVTYSSDAIMNGDRVELR